MMKQAAAVFLDGKDTSFIVKEVFLKVLQAGKVITLYEYKDEIKTRYFYKSHEDGNTITELIYRIYKNGGISSVQKSNTTIEATYIK